MHTQKIFLTSLIAILLNISLQVQAIDLNTILESLSSSNSTENISNNILSTSNIEIKDMVGRWKATGPAVVFKSKDLLKKAGGVAISTTLKNNLAPYYTKAGLDKMIFTVESNGKFTMEIPKGKATGQIVKENNGTFIFKFNVIDKHEIGAIKTYVQKGTSLDIMFDITRLIDIIAQIASYSGNSTVDTALNILKGYDGICAGFSLKKQ